jgi:hypothetical protein
MDEKLREALTDRGPQESTVRRVTATTDRARCGEAYGPQPPPPSGFRKYQPKTSRREPGRRCPLRRVSQCCGRGEAAGDCVSTAARFFDGFCRPRTARTGYASCSSLGVSLRPGPTGSIGQEHKTRTELKGGRVQWGERRVRGRRRHRILQLCRTRARRYPHRDRDDHLRRRPRGDCEELGGVFP